MISLGSFITPPAETLSQHIREGRKYQYHQDFVFKKWGVLDDSKIDSLYYNFKSVFIGFYQMFCDRILGCFQFLAVGFLLLPVHAREEPCTFVPVPAVNSCEDNDDANSVLNQMKDMICPFPDLREAMADERMAQVIAGNNVFQTIESNDVVRLKEGVGLYVALNPLKKKINNTYKTFHSAVQGDFTLNITTYPAEVRKGTCADHSTITKQAASQEEPKKLEELETLLEEVKRQDTEETLGVQRDISGVFGDYLTVKGRDPRRFELRKNQKGDILICEAVKISLEERVNLYCKDSDLERCRKQMPPLCSEWDQQNSQESVRNKVCTSLSAFEKVSGEFFMNNMTMNNFCPEDCSYYVQLLQRVRKEEKGHCAESHAIVHCGPKKTEAKYNLNIKVVDDFCEDFGVMCAPSPTLPAV